MRWTLLALATVLLYRAIPREPDAALRAVVAQQLRFDYSERRRSELRARGAERSGDALLAIADDVLNAQIAIDAIGVRGPLLPPPLPRWVVVRVRYRVTKGAVLLESDDRCLVLRKVADDDWRPVGERRGALACLAPA